jgi:signal transduction histidine kinase
MHATNMVLLIIFAALLTNKRVWILLMILTSFTFSIYAYLFTSGILSFSVNIETYAVARSTWIVQLVSLITFQLAVAFSVNYLLTSLIMTHNEKENLIRTEKDRLELLVNERTKQLEYTMKELIRNERLATVGSLVIGVSHEVNTPLGVALSSATFLTAKSKELEVAYNANKLSKNNFSNYIQTINESSKMIVNGLELAVSSMNKFKELSVHQDDIVMKQFELCDIIGTVTSTLKTEYQHTPHELELHCNKEVMLYSSPRLFTQIIRHLTSNSIAHAFEDDKKGKIIIKIYQTSDNLEIIFDDNGKGIDKERIEHIFEPFYKHDISKGSGLGLCIVCNIVTVLLKGTIRLDTTYENGSRFIINIPMTSLTKDT